MARTSPDGVPGLVHDGVRTAPPTLTQPRRRLRPRVRLTVAALAAVAVAVPIALPHAAADDLKDRKHKVHKHIQSAKADLDESSRALESARSRLRAANGKLSQAQHRLAGTQAKLRAAAARDAKAAAALKRAQAALAEAKAEHARAQAQVKQQRREIGLLAAQNYQYGGPQLMGLVAVLDAGNPGDVTTQLNTVHSMMNRQANTLDSLKTTEAKMRAEALRVQRFEATVASRRQAAKDVLEERRQIERAAAADRHQVALMVDARSSARDHAASVRSADLRSLKKLKREEDRITQKILARAAKQKGGYHGDTGGFLLRPVDGYITSPFGWRKHPIYGYWGLHNGADFHAPCGTPLRAAGNGTVVQRYFSDVWGNRLLIDLGKVNGANITVIYNHLSSYKVGVGSHVSRGSTVGWSGTTGWSTGCHLHFTVLKNGQAVNPANYF